MRALDWLLRTAMLVLACMATLAMIGSLASVSGGSLADAVPGRVERAPVQAQESGQEPTAEVEVLTRRPDPNGRAEPAELQIAPIPQPEPGREIARWLKALTYAVLALAAFAAAGVVALLRIGSTLKRIAER